GVESDCDEAFCVDLAARFNVPLDVLRVSDEERSSRRGESVQEWARNLRRSHFARYAQDGYAIALVHHADDLAENVLMRLARGAAAANLLGMREWDAPLWRPFLSLPKKDLLDFLQEAGLNFRQDSSNFAAEYSRNVMRQRILPELE